MEAMHQRAMSNPIWMKQRRDIVEHPLWDHQVDDGQLPLSAAGIEESKGGAGVERIELQLKRIINIQGVQMLLHTLRPYLG